jgi:mutator protein MutT
MITVAAAVISKNGLILAARKRKGLHLAGLWEFPGGKVEVGESPQSCLKRELREELAIECTIEAFIGESIYDYESKRVRLLGYYAVSNDSPIHLTDHDRICWLPPEELYTLNWAPADIPLVENVKADGITFAITRYYDAHVDDYIKKTKHLEMTSQWREFTSLLPNGGHLLDIGCGSGRDSRYFLDKGYQVTAIDPSPRLAAAAEKYLGQPVAVLSAQRIEDENRYDGVWACASLIHVPRLLLPESLKKIVTALKTTGILYISFKIAAKGDRKENDCYINSISQQELITLLKKLPSLLVHKWWLTTSAVPESDDEWLNILCRKL